jgi:hypothetical protein
LLLDVAFFGALEPMFLPLPAIDENFERFEENFRDRVWREKRLLKKKVFK